MNKLEKICILDNLRNRFVQDFRVAEGYFCESVRAEDKSGFAKSLAVSAQDFSFALFDFLLDEEEPDYSSEIIETKGLSPLLSYVLFMSFFETDGQGDEALFTILQSLDTFINGQYKEINLTELKVLFYRLKDVRISEKLKKIIFDVLFFQEKWRKCEFYEKETEKLNLLYEEKYYHEYIKYQLLLKMKIDYNYYEFRGTKILVWIQKRYHQIDECT